MHSAHAYESTRPAPPVRMYVQIDFESQSNFYEGFEPHEVGVFVASYVWQRLGTVVDLTVELPGGFEVQAAGIVRWVSVADDEDDVMPGMGVELLGIDGTAAEMIRAFIASRPPRFHA